MLSRHWRLWLSFPPSRSLPESGLGISLSLPTYLCAPASWARFPASWLWSRRLTEPPRPLQREERKNKMIKQALAGVLHTNNACSFMLRHIALCKGRQKSPSAEGAISRRLTEDTPLPASADAPRTVAAALSAAVTSTKRIENRTPLSGGTMPAEAHNPNASRSSGGSAREGLLSEKPPPSHHFAFGLKMIAARAPKKIAAAMPAEVEVRPPVKAPMKPIS